MSTFLIYKLTFSAAVFAVYSLDACKYGQYLKRGGTRSRDLQEYWPWQVVFFPTMKDNTLGIEVSFCGGALVDHHWIITSLECVRNVTYLSARLGVPDLSTPNLILPIFRSDTHHNSHIAIIQIIRYVEYTKMIRHIPIESFQDAKQDVEGATLYSGGFGMPQNWTEGPKSDQLTIIKVRVVSSEECLALYEGEGSRRRDVARDVICVRSLDETSDDICSIDMGNPLAAKGEDGEFTLLAVSDFSSSRDCDSRTRRGFTRVGLYHEWLKNKTENGSNSSKRLPWSTKLDYLRTQTLKARRPVKKFRGKSKKRIILPTAESDDENIDFII